jgi:hypothetical protein
MPWEKREDGKKVLRPSEEMMFGCWKLALGVVVVMKIWNSNI